jgi:hypothetical protein
MNCMHDFAYCNIKEPDKLPQFCAMCGDLAIDHGRVQ